MLLWFMFEIRKPYWNYVWILTHIPCFTWQWICYMFWLNKNRFLQQSFFTNTIWWKIFQPIFFHQELFNNSIFLTRWFPSWVFTIMILHGRFFTNSLLLHFFQSIRYWNKMRRNQINTDRSSIQHYFQNLEGANYCYNTHRKYPYTRAVRAKITWALMDIGC